MIIKQTRKTDTRPRRAATVLVLGMMATLTPAFSSNALPAGPPSGRQGPVKPQVREHALSRGAAAAVAQVEASTYLPASTPATADKVKAKAAHKSGGRGDRVVTLPVSGNLLGVTWPASIALAGQSTIALRAYSPTEGWQEWQELPVQEVLDSSGRLLKYATDPLWVGEATKVQVRTSQASSSLLKSGSVTAVSSAVTDVDRAKAPKAVGGGAAQAAYLPKVLSRAEWGADEALRNGCTPTINPTTKVAVVHHTAGSNNYTAEQSASVVRAIYAYDTKTLKYCDIAYNMLVDKYGQKFEGRYGGLINSVKAAHADSFNTRTFGISILGNYETATVPAAGMRALQEGLAMRLSQYYINPYGTTTLYSEYTGTTSKYPKGAAYQAKNIAAHRESSNTACPGRNLYSRMDEVRRGAATLAGWSTTDGYASPIYKRYKAEGGANKFGEVTRGEGTVSGLPSTEFTKGLVMYSTPAGVRVLDNDVSDYWRSLGATSKLGHPTTDELKYAQGATTEFSKGYSITKSSAGFITVTNGGIRSYWIKRGGITGSLGAPTGPMITIPGGWQQQFAGGLIKADAATGNVWKAA